MSENVLVTGGAGYIGSVVAAQLLSQNYRVTVLDNLTHGSRAAVPEQARFELADVGDAAALERVFQGGQFDAVLHFASFIEAGESMRAPELYFRNNTVNTLTLLEVMLQHGVRKLVFSSTAGVYGNPERTPIEETDRLLPTNPYGESKLLAERMLDWFQQVHGLRYASLRYFNAAGATPELGEDHRPESHLMPIVLETAAGLRECIPVYGSDYPTPDGTCVRDYIHVTDLAVAHLLALTALDQEAKLIYNLGNGRGFSVLEVIETARRVTGRPIPSSMSARRPGDAAVLVARSDKIRRELNWQPRFPELEVIVRSAWKWRMSHPNGYSEKSRQLQP
jgi:UDP-glucose 4-epimerase